MKELSLRERDILDILISEYISTALPVGSGTIAQRGALGLSTATIRNVLAQLEEMGFLVQPHTSAGRVPTNAGLRYYINTIVKRHSLSDEEQGAIYSQVQSSGGGIDSVLKKTGEILSLMSNYTGLVVLPKLNNVVLKHIEFIPLTSGKIMGIFVSREGDVHNWVIDVGEEFTYLDIEKMSNYCNKFFYGLTLQKARNKAVRELNEEQARYDRLTSIAILWSSEMFGSVSDGELLVEGEAKLLKVPEFANMERLRQVVEALEEKKKLVHLLNRAVDGNEVCVFIGTESGYDAVSDCGIVTTAYKKGGEVLGTIGVIGPARMDYSRIIPTVDFTARLVSRVIETNSTN